MLLALCSYMLRKNGCDYDAQRQAQPRRRVSADVGWSVVLCIFRDHRCIKTLIRGGCHKILCNLFKHLCRISCRPLGLFSAPFSDPLYAESYGQ